MPRLEAERIVQALSEMSQNPDAGDVRQLRGNAPAELRRRIGNWRVLFDIDHDEQRIDVVAIRRRNERTYS